MSKEQRSALNEMAAKTKEGDAKAAQTHVHEVADKDAARSAAESGSKLEAVTTKERYSKAQSSEAERAEKGTVTVETMLTDKAKTASANAEGAQAVVVEQAEKENESKSAKVPEKTRKEILQKEVAAKHKLKQQTKARQNGIPKEVDSKEQRSKAVELTKERKSKQDEAGTKEQEAKTKESACVHPMYNPMYTPCVKPIVTIYTSRVHRMCTYHVYPMCTLSVHTCVQPIYTRCSNRMHTPHEHTVHVQGLQGIPKIVCYIYMHYTRACGILCIPHPHHLHPAGSHRKSCTSKSARSIRKQCCCEGNRKYPQSKRTNQSRG